MASSSKDESIIIWNMDRIKSANQNDAIVSVLQEHQNIIDCVKWANAEACATISHADYNMKQMAMLSSDEIHTKDQSATGGTEAHTTQDGESAGQHESTPNNEESKEDVDKLSKYQAIKDKI